MIMYTVRYSKRAIKEFNKLDRYTRQLIYSWIGKNLDGCENPRIHVKPLTANLSGLWRYLIGDYRLLCEINDNNLIILAMSVGHRKQIYSR